MFTVVFQSYNPHNPKILFGALFWLYGQYFFFSQHIWDQDLRWGAKSNLTKVEFEGGDEEEEEEDDE